MQYILKAQMHGYSAVWFPFWYTFQGHRFLFYSFGFLFFLLVRDISFQKVLVRLLLGFSQIQEVLVFQLHGFREFLINYSVEVIRLKKVLVMSLLVL